MRTWTYDVENSAGLLVRSDVRVPDGDGPFPVVVILHGFKGFKDWGMFPPTAAALVDAGFATVTLNTSRNGVGDGDPTTFDDLEGFAENTPGFEVEDVECVLGGIRSGAAGPNLDAGRIGLLGHSRGGGVVLLVAARNEDVRAVVTWASVARFLRWTPRACEIWRREGRLSVPNARTGQEMWMNVSVLDDLETRAEEYDLERAVGASKAPLLVIHGEQDEAVAVADAESIHGWAGDRSELSVIPRTGHTFGAKHPWEGPAPGWESAVLSSSDWFRRHLK